MAFENLAVKRLILHEVYKRRLDGNLVPPKLSAQLAQLQQDAMDAFKERVVEAMGSDAQSMEMNISDAGPNSGLEIAATLISSGSDATFVVLLQSDIAIVCKAIEDCPEWEWSKDRDHEEERKRDPYSCNL